MLPPALSDSVVSMAVHLPVNLSLSPSLVCPGNDVLLPDLLHSGYDRPGSGRREIPGAAQLHVVAQGLLCMLISREPIRTTVPHRVGVRAERDSAESPFLPWAVGSTRKLHGSFVLGVGPSYVQSPSSFSRVESHKIEGRNRCSDSNRAEARGAAAVRNEVGGKDEMPHESNTERRNHLLPPISVSLSSQLV
ncbi:hypothetical protein GW17_00008816 [Ensete ventricosum]|nr:hypothetical protein GW17_00008816 [Ensete ventricosum]